MDYKKNWLIYTKEKWEDIVKDLNGDDVEAREKAGEMAYNAMFPFIIFTAKKVYGSYMKKHSEDLLQEGCVGLCEGLKNYDPYKSKPTTWCYRFIVHRMREFIAHQVHNTTAYYWTNMKRILEFINERKVMGETCTIDDIMEKTGFSRTTVKKCLMIYCWNKNIVSIG